MMHYPIKMLYNILKIYRFRLTIKRIANLIALGASMGISKLLRRTVSWGGPALLMVEPTNLCNLKCPMCPSGAGEMTRQRGKMDLLKYKNIIDQIGDRVMLIQFWNQGEPFIHAGFLEMVTYAKSRHIATMTSTNGHFLVTAEKAEAVIRSGLDEIIVSLDGLDQKTYEKYRVGGKYQTVLDGIRNLISMKNKLGSTSPIVHMQFLVLKHNEEQIEDVIQLGRDLGVDLISLKSAQVYSDKQAEEYLPENESFKRYDTCGKTSQIKSSFPNWCKFLWYGAVLNWDGAIAPCCFDKDGEFAYGNVFGQETSFQSVWVGDRRRKFLNQILKDRALFPMCRNCFEGMKQDYVKYVVP